MKCLLPLILTVAVIMVALGFNTIDHMIIQYKFYTYWRSLDTWEMSYWLIPHWWDAYIYLGILPLGIGSGLVGYIIGRLRRET